MLVALAAVVSMAACTPASSTPDPIASALIPTASDRALYEEGRSKERIAFSLVRPQIFAIALLRDRSLSDLTVTQHLLSQYPLKPRISPALAALATLRPYIETGDFSHVDTHIWDAGAAEWHIVADPETTWIIQAGEASVDVDAARADQYADVALGSHAMGLMEDLVFAGQYAGVVPPKDRAAIVPQLPAWPSLVDGQAYESDLSERLANVFPEAAYPPITYGTGLVADARRGVAMETATEMLGVPGLLSQRESQSFIDEMIASLRSATNERTLQYALNDARIELATPTQFESWGNARVGMLSADMTAYSLLIGSARLHCYTLGQDAAEAFFEASIGFDPKRIATNEKWVGALADLDPSIPGLKSARLELLSSSAADPLAIRTRSLRVIDLIMGSN